MVEAGEIKYDVNVINSKDEEVTKLMGGGNEN